MKSDAELTIPHAPRPGAKKVTSPVLVWRGTTGAALEKVVKRAREANRDLNIWMMEVLMRDRWIWGDKNIMYQTEDEGKLWNGSLDQQGEVS